MDIIKNKEIFLVGLLSGAVLTISGYFIYNAMITEGFTVHTILNNAESSYAFEARTPSGHPRKMLCTFPDETIIKPGDKFSAIVNPTISTKNWPFYDCTKL